MDKDMQQGHEPEHVDLTQIEDEPRARADPLFERQTDLTELAGPWFGARFYSDTPVGSPAATATALLKVVVAAGLPAAGLAAGGWALGVAGWLTLTLAALIFLVIWAVGLLLILRIEPSLPAPRETSCDHSDGKNDGQDRGTDPRTDCDETYQRHRRHPVAQPEPTRAPRALQPPRRR